MRQNINLQLKTESVYSRLIDLKELSHDMWVILAKYKFTFKLKKNWT